MALLYDEGMRCGQSYKVPDLKKNCLRVFSYLNESCYVIFLERLTQSQKKKKVRNFQSVEEERGEENKIQRIFQNTELH